MHISLLILSNAILCDGIHSKIGYLYVSICNGAIIFVLFWYDKFGIFDVHCTLLCLENYVLAVEKSAVVYYLLRPFCVGQITLVNISIRKMEFPSQILYIFLYWRQVYNHERVSTILANVNYVVLCRCHIRWYHQQYL